MKLHFYKKIEGDLEIFIEGTKEAKDEFKRKYLIRDIKGNFLEDGDIIQGYNNRKYGTHNGELAKTGFIEVSYPEIYKEVYGDTFEPYCLTENAWIWKV